MLMSFPYYWYTVSSFWIGSNGYINFSSPANFASPFAQLPNTATPNDMLAICTGDLDFTITATNPRCLYWTNGNDSLVVSFINVTEWQTTSNPNLRHTFQVILNRTDSSITYQYGVQQGRYNAPNNTTLCIGMENATGQIGLSYTFSTTPPHALLPDSGIAIKWKRTVNTGLSVTDVGTVGGFNPLNQGKIIRAGVADTIRAIVRNFGTANLTNVRVTYQISRALEVYRDTIFIPTLNAAQQTTVTFPRLFLPSATGTYTALFSSFVAGDVGPGNNNKTAEIVVSPFAIGQSTRLQFENGAVGGSINWSGGGGMGVAFDLPASVYPVRIETVFVNISAITTQPMTVQILDGSLGAPGAVLAERIVNAVVGLNTINFTSDSVRIRGGRFFVGGRGQMSWSYELTPPIANRSWEYTGGWAPYRSADLQDVIMRATVRPEQTTGVGDGEDEILPQHFALMQNYPNPFNPTTTILYLLPQAAQVKVSIYNMLGQRVVELANDVQPAGSHQVEWDARNDASQQVASGVYFYRLEAHPLDGSTPFTSIRKMLFLK
jgi:hypothetical protein